MIADATTMIRLLRERPRREVLECRSDELTDAARALLEGGFRLALVSARHDDAVIDRTVAAAAEAAAEVASLG